MDSSLETALRYAANGWAVFPCVQNAKVPMTGHGVKDASHDPAKIKSWWTRNPKANLAIACGMVSGIVVVDVDVKKKAKGRESSTLIRGLLPRTMTVTTPSGGWHLFYKTDSKIKGRLNFLPGIDVKSDGGYVVAPPSEIDGKKYAVVIDGPIVRLHDVLKNKINAIEIDSPKYNFKARPASNGSIEVSVGPHDWNGPMLKLVARMVRRGYSDSEILAHSERYTLSGWTNEQTRRQVRHMIDGARRKGFYRR